MESKFDRDSLYNVVGEDLQRIERVMNRLYGDRTLQPGEMCDLAKQLDEALKMVFAPDASECLFTWTELVFMVSALNGVGCMPQTFAANLWGAVPYQDTQGIEPNVLIGKVSRLSLDLVTQLHSQVVEFWAAGDVDNIRDRMEAVGLLKWCQE